jgi:hypothetical protein
MAQFATRNSAECDFAAARARPAARYSSQDFITRNSSPGIHHQEFITRNSSPGIHHQEFITGNSSPGIHHREFITVYGGNTSRSFEYQGVRILVGNVN